MKKKALRKVYCLTLAAVLLFQPTAATLVLAQEVSPEATPSAETVVPSESNPGVEDSSEEVSAGDENASGAQPAQAPSEVDSGSRGGEATALEAAQTPCSGEGCPTATAENAQTGEESQNESQASAGQTATVENTNEAEVASDAAAEASSGQNAANENDGDVTLTTNEATASAALASEVNTNATVDEQANPSAQATNQDTGAGSTNQAQAEASQNLEVNNTNTGEVENTAAAAAETGTNQANANDGDVTITTGGATAIINLINFLNTNFSGFSWDQLVVNIFGQSGETINLIESFLALLQNAFGPSASASNQNTGADSVNEATASASVGLAVNNQNSGSLTNNLTADANTGGNTADANDGDITINTGNAQAVVNLLNFLNTNITGSQWLMALINIFGLWNGDLVLPAPGVLESASGDGTVASANTNTGANSTNTANASQTTTLTVDNQNESTVTSNAAATADSGNNSAAKNDGEVAITTGETQASVFNLNFINTNLIGNNWLFLLINNLGKWTGMVIGWLCGSEGAPSGLVNIFQADLTAANCPNCVGVSAANANTGAASTNVATATTSQTTDVSNHNQGTLINNVNASATTGNNSADKNDGDISINTGSALALANVINFVNTNIVGSKFLFGIVNIFGEWTGNLIFGYPDLTISISDGMEQAQKGQILNYLVTYRNDGLAPAANSVVRVILPDNVQYLSDTAGVPPQVSGQTYTWILPGLAAKAATSFTVTGKVTPDLASGTYPLNTQAAISTRTPECDQGNNMGSDQTLVEVPITPPPPPPPPPPGPGPGPGPTPGPTPVPAPQPGPTPESVSKAGDPLSIYKFNDAGGGVKHRGEQVTFTIVLDNSSDRSMYSVVVRDYLEDPLGTRIREQSWDLGEVKVNEEIQLTYTIEFTAEALFGRYTNYAQAFGKDPDGQSKESIKVSSEVQVEPVGGLVLAAAGPEGVGEVLGAAVELPVTGSDSWQLVAAAFCLILAGLILRWGFVPVKKNNSLRRLALDIPQSIFLCS